MLLAGSSSTSSASSTSDSVELAATPPAAAPAAELALPDDAPIEQLMLVVFEKLHLSEVCGGTQPQAAAAFFARKGLSRVGQLRKSRANQRLKIQLDELGRQLLKRAPLDVCRCHDAHSHPEMQDRPHPPFVVRRAKPRRCSSMHCERRSGGSSIGSYRVRRRTRPRSMRLSPLAKRATSRQRRPISRSARSRRATSRAASPHTWAA